MKAPIPYISFLLLSSILASLCDAERIVPALPSDGEKIRILIDADTANEIDDLYAIALALISPERFEIEGIVAAHFGDYGGSEGIDKSYDLTLELLEIAGMKGKIPVYKGSPPFQYSDTVEPSPGVDFIIERAMDRSDDRPLWIVSLGACTNIAMAWKKEPSIKDHVRVLWHGRTQWPVKCWNFNAYNDIKAVRTLMGSDLPLVLFDTGQYLRATMDETAVMIAPHGPLGKFLHQYRYRNKFFQSPTKGFFDLGDIAILYDASLAEWETVAVPEVDWDYNYRHNHKHGEMLRVYQIRNRPALDLLSKKLEEFADKL
jgi:inosine-uridine nucleoside N-ribohydrolase